MGNPRSFSRTRPDTPRCNTTVDSPARTAGTERKHYSIRCYEDPDSPCRFLKGRFGGPVGMYFSEYDERFVGDWLTRRPVRTVADIGSGAGRVASVMRRQGWYVVEVDASLPMLLAGLKMGGAEHASSVRADAHQLPFADESVDAVIGLRVLMHVERWEAVLREMCRIAADLVLIDFPPSNSFVAGMQLFHPLGRRLRADYQPYRILPVGGVGRVFRRAGFSVVAIERQFLLPFFIHRALGRPRLSYLLERAMRHSGLTRVLGAPAKVVAIREAR